MNNIWLMHLLAIFRCLFLPFYRGYLMSWLFCPHYADSRLFPACWIGVYESYNLIQGLYQETLSGVFLENFKIQCEKFCYLLIPGEIHSTFNYFCCWLKLGVQFLIHLGKSIYYYEKEHLRINSTEGQINIKLSS